MTRCFIVIMFYDINFLTVFDSLHVALMHFLDRRINFQLKILVLDVKCIASLLTVEKLLYLPGGS